MSITKRIIESEMHAGVGDSVSHTDAAGNTVIEWSGLEDKQADILMTDLEKEFGMAAVFRSEDKNDCCKVTLTFKMPDYKMLFGDVTKVEGGKTHMAKNWIDITQFVKQFVPQGTIEDGVKITLNVNGFTEMVQKAKTNKEKTREDGNLKVRWKGQA